MKTNKLVKPIVLEGKLRLGATEGVLGSQYEKRDALNNVNKKIPPLARIMIRKVLHPNQSLKYPRVDPSKGKSPMCCGKIEGEELKNRVVNWGPSSMAPIGQPLTASWGSGNVSET